MTKKREPNPYTKYGRKRMRNEMTPEMQKETEWMTAGCLLIVVVVMCIFLFIIGGGDAVLDWLSK